MNRISKDIQSHMTADEKAAAMRFGAKLGVMVAVFLAIPLSFGVVFLRPWLLGLPGLALLAWLGLGVYVLMNCRKQGKNMLCSTRWAKAQGITPDKL